MLTRLRVENFKALKNLDLPLRTRNVFIGPNKSGKSTILQVLQFLTQLVNVGDVSRVFNGELGFQQLLWKGISEGNIRVDIWGHGSASASDRSPAEFYYSIEFGLDALRNLAILSEGLTVTMNGKELRLIEARSGQGEAIRASGEIVFQNPESSIKPFLSYEVPGWEGNLIRKYISGWQFFSMVPQLPKVTPAPSGAQPFLDASGAQLSSWLHTFQSNYPEAFERIVAVAREAFQEIKSITVPVTQAGTTFLSTTEKGLKSPISIFYASDGEVKFLQLLSIIFSPLPVSLVGIEEPENHLHPRLLELLVETANQVRVEIGEDNASQVFVTTHSPYLVDLLKPEDVLIVEKRNAATRCTRATDKENLRQLLEESEMSFGSLWYSGALGGV
jgi:predicted ATPase